MSAAEGQLVSRVPLQAAPPGDAAGSGAPLRFVDPLNGLVWLLSRLWA
jgi:hypothetical protein